MTPIAASDVRRRTPGAAPDRDLYDRTAPDRDRLLFVAVVLYVLGQSFLVPIAAVGPSWVVWPTLPDLATGLVGAAVVLRRGSLLPPPGGARRLFLFLMGAYGVMAVSFLHGLTRFEAPLAKSLGLYYLVRGAQFIVVFLAATSVDWTAARRRILLRTVETVLVVTCAGIFLTYLGVVPLGSLVAHLPTAGGAAGPWSDYPGLDRFPDVTKGLGFVGYNHAYPAAQVLVLFVLRQNLVTRRSAAIDGAFLCSSLAATLLTDSRMGLASFLVLSGVVSLLQPKLLVAGFAGVLLLAVTLDFSALGATLERQATILDPGGGDNLAGRPLIWDTYFGHLNAEPLRWFTGSGLGAGGEVMPTAFNCHLLPLQIIVDSGVFGLAYWCAMLVALVAALVDAEDFPYYTVLLTGALIFAGLTQESLYPAPALGHLAGLYLFVVGTTLAGSRFRARAGGEAPR